MYLNERRYFPFTESKEEFPIDSQRERIYASESLTRYWKVGLDMVGVFGFRTIGIAFPVWALPFLSFEN